MKLVDILAHELKSWPEDCGAIEQDRRGTCLYKVNGPAIATYVGSFADDADSAKVTRDQWQAAVDALKAEKVVEWNGEGLPPVGTICEHLPYNGGSEWHKVEIIAHKNHLMPVAVFWDLRELKAGCSSAHAFRPIRTPEQIAAEERAKQIKEIIQDLDVPLAVASRAFDKGYRKFEIVDN